MVLGSLSHAATFPVTVAALTPEVGRLLAYAIYLTPAVILALLVAAAWFFLDDTGDRLRRYR